MKSLELLAKRFLNKLFYRKHGIEEKVKLPVINENSKVLFIRLNRLGDALVTTPLLHQIKEETGCHIAVLASASNKAVFTHNSDIDEVAVFNKGRKGLKQARQYIRDREFDCIVDLHDDVSTTVNYFIGKAKVPYKFALHKNNAPLFTHTIPKLNSSNNHVIERVMELAKLFGLEPDCENANVRFQPTAQALKKADMYMQKHYPVKKFLIGINISAGSQARFWGVKKFRAVIKALGDYDVDFILFCITRDLDYAILVTNDHDKIFYSPSFDDFSAMISKIDLLFSPDTSTIHVASAYKIPVFGLYVKYNTEDMIWSPYQSDFAYMVTEEPTLMNIEAEKALDKFIPFLEKHLNR